MQGLVVNAPLKKVLLHCDESRTFKILCVLAEKCALLLSAYFIWAFHWKYLGSLGIHIRTYVSRTLKISQKEIFCTEAQFFFPSSVLSVAYYTLKSFILSFNKNYFVWKNKTHAIWTLIDTPIYRWVKENYCTKFVLWYLVCLTRAAGTYSNGWTGSHHILKYT